MNCLISDRLTNILAPRALEVLQGKHLVIDAPTTAADQQGLSVRYLIRKHAAHSHSVYGLWLRVILVAS
jgi:hypothetical protein